MKFLFEDQEGFTNFVSCADLNASGIRRFTPSPIVTTMLRYKVVGDNFDNIDWGDICHFKVASQEKNYIIASGVAHHPNNWCGLEENNQISLFNFLNPKYLRDLRNNEALLLLDQSHEGYQTTWLWQWFHNECDKFKINPDRIIFVTGNLAARDQYSEWCKEHKVQDKLFVIPHPQFENMVCHIAINRVRIHRKPHLPTFEQQYEYKQENLANIKSYNALQKRPRAHRIWFYKNLVDAGILPHGIISMNAFNGQKSYYEHRYLTEDESKKLNAGLPILPPGEKIEDVNEFEDIDSGKFQFMFSEHIMLDTWMSVISESSFSEWEHACFISEKSFKPIACHHPFIIFGNKHSLRYLRELGYKTFSPFIDETYDELNTWERLEAIIFAIKKVINIPIDQKLEWYKGMEEILKHNYQTLIRNSQTNVPNSMIDIQNYYQRKFNVRSTV